MQTGLSVILATNAFGNLAFTVFSAFSYLKALSSKTVNGQTLLNPNAATPLGLAAIQELEQSLPPEHKGAASDPMILLVVLNTASIQLIPTTVAVLRLKYGSENPMDIIPAVLISSLVSVTVGLFLAKVLNRLFPFKAERQAAK